MAAARGQKACLAFSVGRESKWRFIMFDLTAAPEDAAIMIDGEVRNVVEIRWLIAFENLAMKSAEGVEAFVVQASVDSRFDEAEVLRGKIVTVAGIAKDVAADVDQLARGFFHLLWP